MRNDEAGKSRESVFSLISLPAVRRHTHYGSEASSLESEQIRLLYANLPVSIIISAILALLLATVLASVLSIELIVGWYTLLAITLLSRTALFVIWRRRVLAADQLDTSRWLYWFRVGAIITSIIWGTGGVLLSPSGDLPYKVFTAFVLVGLCAGASASLAVDRVSASVFLLFVLLPQIVFLASEGDAISISMSSMGVLFLLFLLGNARQVGLRFEENIHLRQRAINNESILRSMLENSPIATSIADVESNQVVFANNNYISLIESTPEKVVGIAPSRCYAHPDSHDDVMKKVRNGERITNMLVELRSPDGQSWTKWVLASYVPVEYQEKPAILGWFYDITDRKLMEEQVEHMAYHDPLTGMPNRLLLLERLDQAIAIAKRERTNLAMLFIDLDKFKPVNDLYGHNVGDLLLKVVAQRIRDCLRESDTTARIGGDEFIGLLPGIKAESSVLKVAEKIRRALNQPFEIEEHTLKIASSTGVAIYPDHAEDGRQLLKRADIAMYYAKSAGRNCVKLYRPEMEKSG